MRRFLVKTLNLMILVLFLTGCSAFEHKMARSPHMMCDENESLLICDSADLEHCAGYLEETPIIILEERDL